MYAGTTLRHGSGKIVGVHQRIDKVARRLLSELFSRGDKYYFPNIKNILYFEGKNGSDGLSLKKLFDDVPWHFIDPDNSDDKILVAIINDHIYNLAKSLRLKDEVKASFDAAWLAHAITDGLTPAHHYPLGQKIEELFGRPYYERKSLKGKNIIRGKNRRDTIIKNWQYWGAGGVMTSHLSYEMGVATAVSTASYDNLTINELNLINIDFSKSYKDYFFESLKKIHDLNMFSRYEKTRWTTKLAKETRDVLLPEIIKSVVVAWAFAVKTSREDY